MNAYRLLAKIPPHLPRAWVFGVIAWISALPFMGIAILFSMAGWKVAYEFAFACLGGCTLWFFACVLVYALEKATGNVTPWRSDA